MPDFQYNSRQKQRSCVSGSNMRATAEERFWRKVSPEPNTGCWLWTRADDGYGYGVFRVDGKTLKAPRFAFRLTHGRDPLPGLYVCHRRDQPACVNPEHLFEGTQKDNIHDAKSKGRTARGSRSGGAQLTEEKVREIRKRSALGETHSQLAQEFNVTIANISAIKLRRSWRWIT